MPEKSMLMNDDDIVFEILLRLPAKSILRFRSVSKIWLNTIDSFRFAYMHTSTLAAAGEPQILPLYFLASIIRISSFRLFFNNQPLIKRGDNFI